MNCNATVKTPHKSVVNQPLTKTVPSDRPVFDFRLSTQLKSSISSI